jgi:hypothetical protein
VGEARSRDELARHLLRTQMMFTKHGMVFRVDEFGGLWFAIDDQPECYGEKVHNGTRWLRWIGIDI